MMKCKVLIIVGPTASGKSDLAVHLARKFNGEVISADSRQVYRGLDIGTNKITKQEMKGVLHYLLDVADPKLIFSVADFKNLAEKSIDQIIERRKLPIIVGGTGFYIDSLTHKITLPEVPPNKVLRKKFERYSTEELFKMLQESDPRRARSIDKNNKVRLVRALEIAATLGRVPLKSTPDTECLGWVYVGLKPDWQDSERQISTRLVKQLPDIIKESKKLHAKGLSYKRMYELGLEYRYVSLYLQDKLTREELETKLYTELRRYAKRQMTWFKRNKQIVWFRPDDYKKIEKYVSKVLVK